MENGAALVVAPPIIAASSATKSGPQEWLIPMLNGAKVVKAKSIEVSAGSLILNFGEAVESTVIRAPFLYSYQEQSDPLTEAEIPVSAPVSPYSVPSYLVPSAPASAIVSETPESPHAHCGLVPTDDPVEPSTPTGGSGSSANEAEIAGSDNKMPATAIGAVNEAINFLRFISIPFLGLGTSRELSREKHSIGGLRIKVQPLSKQFRLGMPLSSCRETPNYAQSLRL